MRTKTRRYVAVRCSFAPAGCEFVTVNRTGRCTDHPKTERPRLRRVWEPVYDSNVGRLIRRDTWKVGAELHRTDGPAEVHYTPADAPEPGSERWFRHGRVHRIGGPAEVRFHRGDLAWTQEKYAIDGTTLSTEDYYAALADFDDETLGPLLTGHDEVLAAGASPTAVLAAVAAGLRTPAGIAAFAIEGAPAEWARAFETGSDS